MGHKINIHRSPVILFSCAVVSKVTGLTVIAISPSSVKVSWTVSSRPLIAEI